MFNQELLALIKAGLPVLRVWDLLIDRTQRASFREALKAVRQDIRGGASASEALGKHSAYFSDLYLATIRAGAVGKFGRGASTVYRVSQVDDRVASER